MKLIKRNLKKMNYELRKSNLYWKTSLGNMLLLKRLNKLLPLYCRGKVLDAGAGHLLYRNILNKYPIEYESMDFEKTDPELSYVADIQKMPKIKSNRYDFVFSRNVLEHVLKPENAIKEINRVLKKGGYALITVPHLAYLHNEPHDYWRFTKYSLRNLAESNSFEIINLEEIGGLIAFKAYIFETIFLGITYGIPLINKICFWTNYLIQKIFGVFDRAFGMKRLFPLNYLIIVRKK